MCNLNKKTDFQQEIVFKKNTSSDQIMLRYVFKYQIGNYRRFASHNVDRRMPRQLERCHYMHDHQTINVWRGIYYTIVVRNHIRHIGGRLPQMHSVRVRGFDQKWWMPRAFRRMSESHLQYHVVVRMTTHHRCWPILCDLVMKNDRVMLLLNLLF